MWMKAISKLFPDYPFDCWEGEGKEGKVKVLSFVLYGFLS
jgi:hypothetical protein